MDFPRVPGVSHQDSDSTSWSVVTQPLCPVLRPARTLPRPRPGPRVHSPCEPGDGRESAYSWSPASAGAHARLPPAEPMGAGAGCPRHPESVPSGLVRVWMCTPRGVLWGHTEQRKSTGVHARSPRPASLSGGCRLQERTRASFPSEETFSARASEFLCATTAPSALLTALRLRSSASPAAAPV